MSLEPNILERAQYWANSTVFDENTRKEVACLLEKKEERELTERFYRDLEFGTGGLRGILGAGTNRMNIYNVRKAALALARYLKEAHTGKAHLKVAISFDSRRFSKDFARAAAEVLCAEGVQALITKELRPVPMLSFMVRHFKCQAGICVTASHNPPEYNGFKVYWGTGGQLVPPHDTEIIRRYNAIECLGEVKNIAYKDGIASGMIREIGSDFDEAYFEKLKQWHLRQEGQKGFKIVYTPLHGTGLYPVTEMLKRNGFDDVLVVADQKIPDGSFPTVKSPNPEDPKALEQALTLAKQEQADLVLATDPDCDRIGMLVRVGQNYFRPNGNQIGCLLTEYVLSSLAHLGRLPDSPLVIKTIVTTELQRQIAEEFGATCIDTLTGFKWICDLIEKYETGDIKPYRKFVCGGEESYGFLADSFVRDKDGVISCCLAAEMVAYYKSQGLTVVDVLDRMFTRHGVYQESLYNLTLPGKEGAETIAAMMEKLRAQPPRIIDGISVKIFRDFQSAQEFHLGKDGFEKNLDLTLPRSNVLQFILEDGTKISVRPSGTEPKIKFYVSVKDSSAIGKTGDMLQALKTRASERVRRIEELFVSMAR